MAAPVRTGQFWGWPTPRLSPASRTAVQREAIQVTLARTDALIQWGLRYCPKRVLKQSAPEIERTKQALLFGTSENFIDIHIPSFAALLAKCFLNREAERLGCPLADLPITWDRLHAILAASFSIADAYLDDHPFLPEAIGTLWDIPVKTLDRAILDILKQFDSCRPTNEEVVELSAQLDAYIDENSEKAEAGASTGTGQGGNGDLSEPFKEMSLTKSVR